MGVRACTVAGVLRTAPAVGRDPAEFGFGVSRAQTWVGCLSKDWAGLVQHP
jgi:hypothetical protein